jgi:hypothetical protein
MTDIKNAQVLVPLQDLTNIFRDVVREELNAKNEKELQDKFLSPEETCNLFSPAITKPTLESYSQKNLLKKYYLGGRTWYKYSELVDAMKQIKKFSRNNSIA